MAIFNSILMLLAGCGVFMAGMKMMSDGLERSAGKGMKRLFSRISDNRFAGVGVGAAVTAIIQSSSATSVMVIGFVNAGIMTLTQATAIIMGANIGTTVTGIIISFSAFNVSLYASVLAFVGVMMMFFKNDSVKKAGGVLCGLGLLFVGLDAMSGAFGNSEIKNMFGNMFAAIEFPLLLILVGTLFTALIQSSSAATGLLIIMVGQGALSVGNALFIVLGTNIGTCITAVIASVGTTTNAKRTALIHLLFNLAGTIVFTVVLWLLGPYVVGLLSSVFSNPQMQIAWFHVAFNIITTAMLLPFIKQLVKLAKLIIKDKPKPEERIYQLKYIDDRLLHTPPIAVAQVQKEILFMAELAKENLSLSVNALITRDYVNKDKVAENEARINHTYHAIARYLIKLASLSLSESDEKLIGAYHHVISDIERIGDHSENFLEQAEEMEKENVDFSEAAVAELAQMYNKVDNMFDLSVHAFSHRDYIVLERIASIEEEVDAMKDSLGASHIERLNSGDCAVERGTYFFAAISGLERIADHLINIAFSIKNPTGSQSKRKELNEVK
ncbi:MAG: Na/Pi cotransporter family protein [Christensenellales bacterium]|jgi:Na/Pi-cotransporter II-like protein